MGTRLDAPMLHVLNGRSSGGSRGGGGGGGLGWLQPPPFRPVMNKINIHYRKALPHKQGKKANRIDPHCTLIAINNRIVNNHRLINHSNVSARGAYLRKQGTRR